MEEKNNKFYNINIKDFKISLFLFLFFLIIFLINSCVQNNFKVSINKKIDSLTQAINYLDKDLNYMSSNLDKLEDNIYNYLFISKKINEKSQQIEKLQWKINRENESKQKK